VLTIEVLLKLPNSSPVRPPNDSSLPMTLPNTSSAPRGVSVFIPTLPVSPDMYRPTVDGSLLFSIFCVILKSESVPVTPVDQPLGLFPAFV
jgi:hypothetical protein